MASRRSFVIRVLIAAVTAAAVGLLLMAGRGAPPVSAASAIHRIGPLSAAQRIERERFLASKRGIQFGVPSSAYRKAMGQRRAMETRASQPSFSVRNQQGLEVGNAWNFIGPMPMLENLANFGGVIVSQTPLANSTGRISAIAVDPNNSDNIFVGAANGGVWMSSDGGTTFTSVFDNEPTQAIGSIAIDPATNPSTVYVGTGEGNASIDSYYGQGLFVSTDLGASWTQIDMPQFDQMAIGSVAVFTPVGGSPVIFAGVSSGNSAGRADPFFNESVLENQGLWISDDGGTTWNQFFAGNPVSDVVVVPPATIEQSAVVYAAVNGIGVELSTDGGNTFAPVTFPGITSQGRQSIAVATNPSAAGTVYAMVGDQQTGVQYDGFFKSTDGGITWTAQSVPQVTIRGVTLDGTSSNNVSQAFFDQALMVDPTDPTGNHVIFGGVGLYSSTNGGQSWTFLPANGGTHTDQHALAATSQSSASFLVGNDGGFYLFNAGNATFTALNTQISAGQIQGIGPHPTNNMEMIAGFQDNGTQLYNVNMAWPVAGNGSETGDGGFALFDPTDPNFAYHDFASGRGEPDVSTSKDAGVTWDSVDPTNALSAVVGADAAVFYPPLAVDPSVAHRVLFGAHHIYASTDGMFGWALQEPMPLVGAGCNSDDQNCALQDVEFAPSDDTRAYALSEQEFGIPFALFNTTQANLNKGARWIEVDQNLGFDPSQTQATGIAINPANALDAYLSISGFTASTGIHHIFRTMDFGATWVQADGNLPDVPVLKILIDRRDPTGNTILAGTDIGVFSSADGGTTWTSFNTGVIPAVPVFDLAQNLNGSIFAGTHGRGAFTIAAVTEGSVSVPSVTNVSGSAGQTVNGGSFTVMNTSGATQAIGSVSIGFSDPALFSSVVLAPAGASNLGVAAIVSPPTATTTFEFGPTLSIPSGQSLTFNLSVTIAMNPAMAEHRVAYAGMIVPAGGIGSLAIALGVIGLGATALPTKMKRRATIGAAALIVIGAVAAGCSGGGGGGGGGAPPPPKPSSTQQVTLIGGASDFSGLPATLGTVSLM